ncbi:MAG: hypothetical protein RPU35_14620 [Candidatus Sedimenticola sp. (ex Thyasira tokunagai)]
MSRISITGFHTCKPGGGASYLLEEGPFLSKDNDRQWLTQGYYFWTDSDYFAHKWGEDGYGGDYAIMRCQVRLDSNLLLDLVGSVVSQQSFLRLVQKFQSHLRKVNRDEAANATVSDCIAYYRKMEERVNGVFPYSAIKAQDSRDFGNEIKFINGSQDKLSLAVSRQQLCLFKRAVESIGDKAIVYPETLSEDSDRIARARAEQGGDDD